MSGAARMPGRARLAISCRDAAAADALAQALGPDNGQFAAAEAEAATLVVTMQSDSVLGLLRSIDDVLAAVRAAQGAV